MLLIIFICVVRIVYGRNIVAVRRYLLGEFQADEEQIIARMSMHSRSFGFALRIYSSSRAHSVRLFLFLNPHRVPGSFSSN